MKLQATFLKPEIFNLWHFSKTQNLQLNRLCSIMAMCIFPGYLSKGKHGMHVFKAWQWCEWTYTYTTLAARHYDALKYTLIICKQGRHSMVVMWDFLHFNKSSSIPVKLSLCVSILRFWKWMFYFKVPGLSKRTSSSFSNMPFAANLSIMGTWGYGDMGREYLWKE